MSETLTVREYNSLEQFGQQDLPFTCREAWAPHLWSKIGFPISVKSLDELRFCSDSMQYHRIDQILKNLAKSVTSIELDDAKQIMSIMSKMFGRSHRTVPYTSILNAIYQLRVIQQVVPSARSVFEIGPGPGYLAYLAHKRLGVKSRISCLENVQAFYLHQNLFLEKTGNLLELARGYPKVKGRGGKIEHVPWWVFAQNYQLDHEVIFGGHVICEMSERSVRQVLARAVANCEVPILILESSGDQRFTQMHSRIDLILEYGFVPSFEQSDLYVFVHPNSKPAIHRDVANFVSTFKFKTKARWHLSNIKDLKAMEEEDFYLKLLLYGKDNQKIVTTDYIAAEYQKYNVICWDEQFLSEIRA